MAKKLKLDGIGEYSNELNDLDYNQFCSFIKVVEFLPKNVADFSAFTKDESKPCAVVSNIIEFFTKEQDLVLDIFSGNGNNLKIIDESDRVGVGIELDLHKYHDYHCSVQEDNYLTEFPMLIGDALEVVSGSELDKFGLFDFIIIDPPIKKFPDLHTVFESYPVPEYFRYLAHVVNAVSCYLKDNKYIVLFVNDVYCKQKFYSALQYLMPIVNFDLVELVGEKIYSSDLDVGSAGLSKIYVPKFNYFHALILKKVGV